MSSNPHSRPDWPAIDTVSWISTALCSTRLTTITSGAISFRSVSRSRTAWTCTRPTRRSRGASRNAAARSTGIASTTGRAARSRHRRAAPRGALARRLAARCTRFPRAHARHRQAAAAAHQFAPDRARRETRRDGRARLPRRRRDVTRIRRAEGTPAILGGGGALRIRSRRAPVRRRQLEMLDAARAPGSAGCSAYGTGTRAVRGANWIILPSTLSPDLDGTG